MKLITRNTDYAIRALCFMAQEHDAVTSVTKLNQQLKIPRPFLRKLLQMLTQEKFINSFKGQGGGFQLVVPADRISIADLIIIFQGALCLNECMFKKRPCPHIRTCRLKKKISAIEQFVFSQLRTMTIGALIDEKDHKE